jgi:hypothetical protein
LPSVASCRRGPISSASHVGLNCSHSGHARYAALKTCGSVWACPQCSLRTWLKRANQLEALLPAVAKADHSATFLTLTMRHSRAQPLPMLWDALSSAWHRLNNDRHVKALRASMGWVGSVRRVEVTHGHAGWHVHAHILETWEKPSPTGQRLAEGVYGPLDFVQTYETACFKAWSSGLLAQGLAAPRRGVGTDLRPLDLSQSAREIARYVSARSTSRESVSLELSDAVGGKLAKGSNRSPWQLLAASMAGDKEACRLWFAWEQGSKGRRALLWSKGIRDRYEALTEDLDLDEPDERETTILALEEELWSKLLVTGCPGELLAVAETGFGSVEPMFSLWDKLAAAQAAALSYLADLGLDGAGLLITDLEREKTWNLLRDAWEAGPSPPLDVKASPNAQAAALDAQLFEVEQRSAVLL